MADPIREALYAVADIIECTYAHDENGRTDGPGDYSGADIVESLCGVEDTVSEAISILDGQGRAVSDLSKEALEAIVSTLLSKFGDTGHYVEWDHQDVASCAYRLLEARGLFRG